jgi:hypothetical protein
MRNPHFDRIGILLNVLSAVGWFILMMIYVKIEKHLDRKFQVMRRLMELLILVQTVAIPLSYELMTIKVCDRNEMEKLGISSLNCSEMNNDDYQKVNCDSGYSEILMIGINFTSGFMVVSFFIYNNDIKSIKKISSLILLLIINFINWWLYFYQTIEDDYPCHYRTTASNAGRFSITFLISIIVILIDLFLNKKRIHYEEEIPTDWKILDNANRSTTELNHISNDNLVYD